MRVTQLILSLFVTLFITGNVRVYLGNMTPINPDDLDRVGKPDSVDGKEGYLHIGKW